MSLHEVPGYIRDVMSEAWVCAMAIEFYVCPSGLVWSCGFRVAAWIIADHRFKSWSPDMLFPGYYWPCCVWDITICLTGVWPVAGRYGQSAAGLVQIVRDNNNWFGTFIAINWSTVLRWAEFISFSHSLTVLRKLNSYFCYNFVSGSFGVKTVKNMVNDTQLGKTPVVWLILVLTVARDIQRSGVLFPMLTMSLNYAKLGPDVMWIGVNQRHIKPGYILKVIADRDFLLSYRFCQI